MSGVTATDNGWSEEEWWKRRETGEQFGIPHPDKMAMMVDEICATRLPQEGTPV